MPTQSSVQGLISLVKEILPVSLNFDLAILLENTYVNMNKPKKKNTASNDVVPKGIKLSEWNKVVNKEPETLAEELKQACEPK
jgi:hypothetical protein